jgi:hypothetical protein
MPSPLLIRIVFLIISLTSCFGINAQTDTLEYIKSPYRAEYTPYFKLNTFKRGFSNDSLKIALDTLESHPRTSWSRYDSLQFAQISLQTGNLALSRYYFDQLNVDYHDENDFWYDVLMIHYLKGDYKGGIDLIRHDSPMIIEHSKLYFFEKILLAKIEQEKDSKWYKSNQIFNWEVDSSLNSLEKDGEEFNTGVIQPLRNLEFVIDKIVAFVHEDDPVLANACREMGHIIQGHLSLTQAYIAYSLGRHYNKWDKELLADLKDVKAQMTQKKYKIPNFRKYFPRIEYWRFDYQMLKEQIIVAKNDTNVYVQPQTMKPEEEPMIKFPTQLIVIGGLILFMVLIAILLKTKKR